MTRPSCRSRSTASGRASPPGTSSSPAPARREPGRHGTFARRRGAAPLRRRDGLRRPLPAARSTRSAEPSARGRTTRRRAGPATPAAPGPSASAEGGHTADPPRARHPRRLRPPRRGRAQARASRSRSTSPSSARPTTPGSREHPEWFRHRPDGTIQYAENPPKKYQDIYPLDFECDDWRGPVGRAARRRSAFWIDHGVTHLPRRQPAHQAVRVLGVADRRGPRASTPTSIFLAEAFTRPKVMHRLAKLGFTPVVHVLHLAQHRSGS